MSTILNAARAAYAAGLCLLPVREDGSKAPDVSSWRAFQTTRPTVEEMREFDFAHRSGVGLIAGAVSGYRECWDFDDPETYQAFVDAAAACGLGDVVQRLRDGYEDETPGGGRRWIVEYPVSVEWRDCTLARRPGRDGEPPTKTLIELPTFAIVAPSNGATHPSGRPYVRLSGGFDRIASYTADKRTALFELAHTLDRMPRPAACDRRPRARTSDSPRPGDDYTARTSWPALLEPHGWTHVYDRDETRYWRRPGKTVGISATTNHAGSDLLYVFSSSTLFEPERGY